MTVGELKAALEAVEDDHEVILFDGCCGTVEFEAVRTKGEVQKEAWAIAWRQSGLEDRKVVFLA